MSQEQDRIEPVLPGNTEPTMAPPVVEDADQEETVEYESAPSGIRRWLNYPSAPIIAAGVLLAGLGIAAAQLAKTPLPGLGSPRVATFDPVRFVNAQRAAASILAATPNADSALILTQVASQAEAVIREEARGATVIVKQAIVAGDVPDITDAVLDRFGLSRNVPTVTTSLRDSLEDIAPTNSVFSSGRMREDYRMELQSRAQAAARETSKADKQAQATP